MRSRLLPDFYYPTIYDVDVDRLLEKGIRGLLLDIDSTLTPHNSQDISEALRAWIAELMSRGIKLHLFSNNNEGRVRIFAEALGLPARHSANKPFLRAFREVADGMGLAPSEIAVIGDQIFTDILGGNRAGMTTVLVETITHTEDAFFKIKRFFERPVRRALRLRREDPK